jgi:hypothetical protein
MGKLMTLVLAILPSLMACSDVDPDVAPPGDEKQTKTAVLETGSALLQTDDPLDGMDVYLVGFHPLKNNPSHQMEAHHFCRQVNQDFAQCILFDGNTQDANLNGIEYIISESIFETLPEDEKPYWHPHNYEILSGQLIAPGVPPGVEVELMGQKMNSYGKTWHVWDTGSGNGGRGDKLPLGDAELAWSFNRDGEAREGLVEARDKRMNIDSQKIRKQRRELLKLAKPQVGVDAIKGEFHGPSEPLDGVKEKQR